MAFSPRTPTGRPSASSDLSAPSDFGSPAADDPSPDEYGGGDDVTLTLPRDVASALLETLQQSLGDQDQSGQGPDGDDDYTDSPLSAGPTRGRGGYGS